MRTLTKKIHVSVHGDDILNDGTPKQPFQTLHRAQEEVRRLLSKDRNQNIQLLLDEGTYYLNATLVLTPEDSPAEGFSLSILPVPGKKVILSGGKRLSCIWKACGHGLYCTPVPPGLSFDQLFINGMRQTRARYPNEDDSQPGVSGYIHMLAGIQADSPSGIKEEDDDLLFSGAAPRGLIYDPATFTPRTWKHPEKAIVHAFQAMYWGNLQWRVREIDTRRHTIWFGQGGTQMGAKWFADPCIINRNSRFFVENVLEELDAPREWYLDEENHLLYYMPDISEDDLKKAVIEVPQLQQIVRIAGNRGRMAQNILIKGVTFRHTAATFLEEYDIPSLGDWAIHRGGCVFLEATRNVGISHNLFDAVGGNAIFLNRYNRRASIECNHIHDAGESGICLVGQERATVGTQRYFPCECMIRDNYIHHCGRFGKQTAGVFISVAKRITVSHCTICHMPRAGICINDGSWGGHIIEYNDVFDTCRETGDHGPINAWGRDRYWCLLHSHGPHTDGEVCHQAGDVLIDQMETVIIRNNRFRDDRGWGLDLDDGASNYHIYNNLCIGVSMKLREGAYRLIENNIWVNGANSPCFHVGNVNNHDRYIRNITVMNSKTGNPEQDLDFAMGAHYGEMYTLIKPPCRGPWMEELDYNLFFNDLGWFKARAITGEGEKGSKKIYTLPEWQMLGFDQHSLFADPIFTDPAHDDYTVQDNSPAIQLGFRNFPMNQFGLTPMARCDMIE